MGSRLDSSVSTDEDNDEPLLVVRWWRLPLGERLQTAWIAVLGAASLALFILAILHPSHSSQQQDWFQRWQTNKVIVFLPGVWILFAVTSHRRQRLERRRGRGLAKAYARWAVTYSFFSALVWGVFGWSITDSPYGALLALAPVGWPVWIGVTLRRERV